MNFATAKDAIQIGMQVRLTQDYGAFPNHVPAGTTGTVVENRLDAIDPVIEVTLDDRGLVPFGRLDIRGPEEAFPVGIKDLAAAALDFDPTDRRHGGREAEDGEGEFLLDDRAKIGRWGNAVPFEVVSPPVSSVETRRTAVADSLAALEEAHSASQMSDDRYATSGRMNRMQQRITATRAALQRLDGA